MIGTYNIQDIHFEQNLICLKIDGNSFKISLDKVSEKLTNADNTQRNLFKVSPSGYGIHWPLIDEDLSVEFLLKAAENNSPN